MVPASFDFWLANLNREASSAGTSIPSDSLNPTDGRNGAEIHGIGHGALPDAYNRLRRPEDTSAVQPAEQDLGTAEPRQ